MSRRLLHIKKRLVKKQEAVSAPKAPARKTVTKKAPAKTRARTTRKKATKPE